MAAPSGPSTPVAPADGDLTDASVRALYRTSFDRLNDRLVDTKFDRYLRFFNFGYAVLPDEAPVGPALPKRFPNIDSAQLLFQTVDGVAMSGSHVVEVGSGRGGNIGLMIDYLGVASAVGVDVALSNVEWCARSYRDRPVWFVQADAEAVPVATSSVSLVVNIESSGCYPHVERFFRDVARMLEPGGRFCWADLARREMVDVYRQALPDLGLRLVDDRDITPNVLASRDARAERQQLVFGDGGKLEGMGDWVGADGSALHDELSDPACCYQIQQWEKVADIDPRPESIFTSEQREMILRFSARGASILGTTATSRSGS